MSSTEAVPKLSSLLKTQNSIPYGLVIELYSVKFDLNYPQKVIKWFVSAKKINIVMCIT